MNRNDRVRCLRELLGQRILVLDGATGTLLQSRRLGEADFRGARFADHPIDPTGNTDLLVLTRPDVVRWVHEQYLEAGADIVDWISQRRCTVRASLTGCWYSLRGPIRRDARTVRIEAQRT